MAFTQQVFFNSTIRSFSASLGFNGSPSQITILLVDDPTNGDLFIQPMTGQPALFSYDTFAFQGLVQKWSKKRSSEGFLNEVILTGPEDLLDSVQIITDSFSLSTIDSPNIVNAFGYLESFGFGNSRVNQTGIEWIRCRDAITDIINGNNPSWGGKIKFKGYSYTIDLDNLPPVSPSYRVSAKPNLTLLDFIRDICEAGGVHFFCALVGTEIVVYTRNFQSKIPESTSAALSQFLDTLDGYVILEDGIELNSQEVGKFLVGGKQKREWFQDYAAPLSTPTNPYFPISTTSSVGNFIQGHLRAREHSHMQFWGYDINRNMIFPDEYINKWVKYLIPGLDVRHVDIPGLGETYTTSYGEIFAVLDSQESWEFFLTEHNSEPKFIKDDGTPGLIDNVYYGLADRLKIIGILSKAVTDYLKTLSIEQIENINLDDLAGLTEQQTTYARKSQSEIDAENISKLYNFLRNYAEEYYGRKYVVKMPETYAKLDDETLEVTTSEIPIDGGYVDGGVIQDLQLGAASGNSWLPVDISRLLTEDGRIECFVRYDSANVYNLDHLDPNDYIISDYVFTGTNNKLDGKSIFVKARALDKVYYTGYDQTVSGYDIPLNLDDPRAIIELSTRVRYNERSLSGLMMNEYRRMMSHLFTPVLKEKDPTLTDDEAAEKTNKIMDKLGSDILLLGESTESDLPSGIGLPLESQILTYGPWFRYGAQGKMDFEQDETLVPWNYNGISGMNMSAWAKIDNSVSSTQYLEMGTVELPGTPISGLTIGSPLVANISNSGPYITDLATNIGEGGVTTTYRFQVFTDRFGKVNQQNIDRFQKMNRTIQQVNRRIQEQTKIPGRGDVYYKKRSNDPVGRVKSRSSHSILAGEVLGIQPSSTIRVVSQPIYNAITQLADNYANKAMVSMDSLFVPFSTNKNYNVGISGAFRSGMLPHYSSMPSGYTGSGVIGLEQLNPYVSGHNIAIITRDEEFTASGIVTRQHGYPSGDIYRALAYRTPMILAGWGYDTNGNPIPGIKVSSSGTVDPSGATTVFDPDYLQDTSKWPVGPLEVKFDSDRRVWVGGTNIVQGFLDENLLAPSGQITSSGLFGTPIYTSGMVRIFNWSGDRFIDSGQKKLVYNVDRTLAGFSGTYVQMAEIGGKYSIVWLGSE